VTAYDLYEELKATHDGEIHHLRARFEDYKHAADGCPTCDLVARFEAEYRGSAVQKGSERG
jgi:hypothetical protein